MQYRKRVFLFKDKRYLKAEREIEVTCFQAARHLYHLSNRHSVAAAASAAETGQHVPNKNLI